MEDINDERMYRDVIDYYRITLAAHKKDPNAKETVKADQAILNMVKETPDPVEMNRQMMEGGLSFRLARAIAVDGANQQAEIYNNLKEFPLAERYKARAAELAKSADMEQLYAISEVMDKEDEPIKENEGRLKSLADTIIEKVMLTDASPSGTDLDESPKTTLTASLDELGKRYPGMTFRDMVTTPRLRKRLFYSDEQLDELVKLFEKVNAERLGGRY